MTWMMGQSAHKVNLKMVQNQEELDEPHGYAAIQKELAIWRKRHIGRNNCAHWYRLGVDCLGKQLSRKDLHGPDGPDGLGGP